MFYNVYSLFFLFIGENMAVQFPDPFPTATSNSKDSYSKVFSITSADTTDVVKAVLPADSFITGINIINTGASTGVTVNIGTVAGGSDYLVNAADVALAGQIQPPIANVINPVYSLPVGQDFQITAKTSGALAATIYVVIDFVR